MDGMLLKRGGDPSKLKTIDEHYIATEGQTVFPIEYVTFDYKRDRVDVISGRTVLSPDLDYSVVGNKITLVEGVPEGRTITIRIMKNVNTDAEDKTMSGAYIEDASIPLSKLAEDVPTAEEVANTYLPLTGGTLSGDLYLQDEDLGWIASREGGFHLISKADDNTQASVLIRNKNAGFGVKNGLMFGDKRDGVDKSYTIFGDHNKPRGSYTGNGSSTRRTIDTGGVGSVLLLWGGPDVLIVTPYGAFKKASNGTSSSGVASTSVSYDSGVLYITTTDSSINASGTGYVYLVI